MSRNTDAYQVNLQRSATHLFGHLPWFLRLPATIVFMLIMPFMSVVAILLTPAVLLLAAVAIIANKIKGKINEDKGTSEAQGFQVGSISKPERRVLVQKIAARPVR